MGMAASQARLLSITSRLTNNEFRSQTITNSKLRLAEKSQEASAEYMEALNSEKLVYGVYNDNGGKTYTPLTANTILSYADLKNQYSIVDATGKILLNSSDIKKYQTSVDMADFLYKCGINKVDNPKYAEKLKDIFGESYEELFDADNFDINSDAELNKWPDNLQAITNSGISTLKNLLNLSNEELLARDVLNNDIKVIVNNWNSSISEDIMSLYTSKKLDMSDLGIYVETLLNYPSAAFPNPDDDIYFDKSGNSELANKYDIATKKCYNNAHPPYSGDGQGCFLHVLAHLLLSSEGAFLDGTQNYSASTTTGKSFNVDYNYISRSAIYNNNQTASLVEVSNEINKVDENGAPVYKAPKDKYDTTTISSSEKDKLLSNYKWVDGEKVLKSWTERVCDLFYASQNREALGINYTSELLPYLDKFQTDMANELSNDFNEGRYNKDVEVWRNGIKKWINNIEKAAKNFSEELKKVPVRKIPDEKDAKYQWYVNLWYRMGSTDENTKGNGTAYKEIEQNLLNNAEWLQFCFEHGILTLEQAEFTEKGSDLYPNMGAYDWVSKPYKNASDFVVEQDDIKIAIAETKYKRQITEIENKDKKYDQDLKKLDTEHTALQTEYDSLKEVISKNTDRSFKAFS